MAPYRLLTAHYCRRRPGGRIEYLPAGTRIEHDGTPSVSMEPLTDEGHAARLRADLAANRIAVIPPNWRDLPLHERADLARAASRKSNRATQDAPSAIKPGPRVDYANCDSILIAEETRRSRLLGMETVK